MCVVLQFTEIDLHMWMFHKNTPKMKFESFKPVPTASISNDESVPLPKDGSF